MSADFWAGYISGAVGILIGNPLDLLKVRLQAGNLNVPATPPLSPSTSARVITPRSYVSYTSQFSNASTLIRGASAPILGYGALNALLFITYNRTSSLLTNGTLNPPISPSPQPNLWTTYLAGALGGLATWVISTPTELIKCRAQTSASFSPSSSWSITKEILRREGIKGLYFGGVITALRDSIGYGFYFWSYEVTNQFMTSRMRDNSGEGTEAAKILLCGGLAGVVTWTSVFPLDVIKTRVQTQAFSTLVEREPLIGNSNSNASSTPRIEGRRKGAREVAKNAYRNEGAGVFFRGLGICSVRAFIVNAAQWAVYEWIMRELDPSRKISGTKDKKLQREV